MMMLMMAMKSDDVDAGKTSLMTAMTSMDGGDDDDDDKVIEDDDGDGNNDGGKDPDGR